MACVLTYDPWPLIWKLIRWVHVQYSWKKMGFYS